MNGVVSEGMQAGAADGPRRLSDVGQPDGSGGGGGALFDDENPSEAAAGAAAQGDGGDEERHPAAAADGPRAFAFLVCEAGFGFLVRECLAERPWWTECVPPPPPPPPPPGVPPPPPPAPPPRGAVQFVWTSCVRAGDADAYVASAVLPAAAARFAVPAAAEGGSSVLRGRGDVTQIANRLPNRAQLTHGGHLLRALTRFYMRGRLNVFDAVPSTFVVRGNAVPCWREVEKVFDALKRGTYGVQRLPPKQCLENVWILKPLAPGMAHEIRLFTSLTKMRKHVEGDAAEYLVQKYVERPMLIMGRKFDVRCWVLLTGRMDVYVYGEGYLRMASKRYALDVAKTKGKAVNSMHNTNGEVQRESAFYGKYEEGNVQYFDDVQAFLDWNGDAPPNCVRAVIFSRMKQIALDVCLSHREWLTGAQPDNWELLELDFVVDEDMRPWFMGVAQEANLDCPTQAHELLVRRMLQDMVRVGVLLLCVCVSVYVCARAFVLWAGQEYGGIGVCYWGIGVCSACACAVGYARRVRVRELCVLVQMEIVVDQVFVPRRGFAGVPDDVDEGFVPPVSAENKFELLYRDPQRGVKGSVVGANLDAGVVARDGFRGENVPGSSEEEEIPAAPSDSGPGTDNERAPETPGRKSSRWDDDSVPEPPRRGRRKDAPLPPPPPPLPLPGITPWAAPLRHARFRSHRGVNLVCAGRVPCVRWPRCGRAVFVAVCAAWGASVLHCPLPAARSIVSMSSQSVCGVLHGTRLGDVVCVLPGRWFLPCACVDHWMGHPRVPSNVVNAASCSRGQGRSHSAAATRRMTIP